MPIHFPIWTCEYLPLLIAPGVNRFMRQAELLITPDMCRRGDPTARSPGADDSARFRERRCDLGPGLNSHGTIQIERDPPATFKRLLGDSGTARALTALPAPHRLLTWPWRRQRGDMAPRLRHDIDQERARDFRQAYEDGGIVAIVLSEEEGMWI